MESVIVRTKNDLEHAQKRGMTKIIIEGKLAVKIMICKKIAIIFLCTLGLLGVLISLEIATAYYTMGMLLSDIILLLALPVIILLFIVIIITACTLGLGLITVISKGYKIIKYENGVPMIQLCRKY